MNAVSEASTTTDHYSAEFARVQARLPGHEVAWLQEMRRTALGRFVEAGIPSQRDEDWKFTRLNTLEQRPFAVTEPGAGELSPEALKSVALPGLEACQLVFVDGYYVPTLSQVTGLPAGVTVRSLAQQLAVEPGVLEGRLGRLVNQERHRFAALNTAFMSDGAYVHLPRGTVLEAPVHLLFISTADQQGMVHPRILVEAEDNAEATIVESYVNIEGGRYLTNPVTEVSVGANAGVKQYRLQEESLKSLHLGSVHVEQSRDSRFTSHWLSLGGMLVRNDIDAVLTAPGSECTLNGLYMGGGRQHMDNQLRVEHAAPHASSRQFYKGALDGRGRGIFTGKIYVHPGAVQSDAEQSNQNLLLSEHAEADARPQLEIYNDDVKCSHGTAVGQLDEEALYYLRSRGIDARAARSLLTYAFVAQVIGTADVAAIREHLEQAVLARLPDRNAIEALA